MVAVKKERVSSTETRLRAGPILGRSSRGLVFAGELDRASAPMFWDALAAALHPRPAMVILDLQQHRFTVAPQIEVDEMRLVAVGGLDIATAPIFSGALTLALHRRPSAVVLDFRLLSFIDSRGVGATAIASERVEEWGGRLTVRGPRKAVRRAFELCGFGHLLSERDGGVDSAASVARSVEVPA